MEKQRKRALTLIEIMIVMLLITIITGAIAYNYRGGLEEGYAFKTHQTIQQIQNIILIEAGDNDATWEELSSNSTYWQELVEQSEFTRGSGNLTRDGWGEALQVTVDPDTRSMTITSPRFEDFRRRHPNRFN